MLTLRRGCVCPSDHRPDADKIRSNYSERSIFFRYRGASTHPGVTQHFLMSAVARTLSLVDLCDL